MSSEEKSTELTDGYDGVSEELLHHRHLPGEDEAHNRLGALGLGLELGVYVHPEAGGGALLVVLADG